MWAVWKRLGFVSGYLAEELFLSPSCPTPESITRARRKVQELYPDLQASKAVREARQEKEKSKGTWVFREGVAYRVEG